MKPKTPFISVDLAAPESVRVFTDKTEALALLKRCKMVNPRFKICPSIEEAETFASSEQVPGCRVSSHYGSLGRAPGPRCSRLSETFGVLCIQGSYATGDAWHMFWQI